MKILSFVAFLAGYAASHPLVRKDSGLDDAAILNYALTLEHLEDTFYRQGLANFTHQNFLDAGFADPFYQNLVKIAEDEATHVEFLTTALQAAGAPATGECTYSFPVVDVQSFVAISSVLEGVGTSAYLGAAALIDNKDYLTAAGSVLTIEARHSSYIRSSLAQSPFPQAFENPLSVNQVYTLASPFIKSCPSTNPSLPVKAFPALTLATPGPIKANSTIVLHTSGYVLADPSGTNSTQLYGAFITVTGPIFVDATPVTGGYSLVVPEGVNGQSYVVLTACHERVTDSTTAAGPALVEISN